MDCSLPSSSVHEISQTRILEWIAISFSSSNVYVWWVFFFFFLIYFWLCWFFIAACRLSLVVESRGYSCGEFLIAMASLVEQRLQRARVLVVVARGLQRSGSVFVVHRFSWPKVCGIFPDQGSNWCPPHWQGFFTTEPSGKSWLKS